MLKNKHTITALIVAPILSLMAYFATDFFVSERPQQAQSGGQYPLLPLPDCRYASGQCGLKNGNFKIIVTGNSDQSGRLLLQIKSVFTLTKATISVARDSSDTESPTAMEMFSDDGKIWRAVVPAVNPLEHSLRLVVAAEGAVYYAETALPFLNYETSFKKDFRPRD